MFKFWCWFFRKSKQDFREVVQGCSCSNKILRRATQYTNCQYDAQSAQQICESPKPSFCVSILSKQCWRYDAQHTGTILPWFGATLWLRAQYVQWDERTLRRSRSRVRLLLLECTFRNLKVGLFVTCADNYPNDLLALGSLYTMAEGRDHENIVKWP